MPCTRNQTVLFYTTTISVCSEKKPSRTWSLSSTDSSHKLRLSIYVGTKIRKTGKPNECGYSSEDIPSHQNSVLCMQASA